MSAGNKFLTSISNITTTENNAVTFKSTLSGILDFFFHGAALRGQDANRILSLFQSAFHENPETALRILFYIRDIRGGQGERQVFRTILQWLGDNEHIWLSTNLYLIPLFGRWDDLFVLLSTKCHYPTLEFISEQIKYDYTLTARKIIKEGDKLSPTLLAKWMPSENASSARSKKLAGIFRSFMKLTPKEYRRMLSCIREALRIVERSMSKNEWSSIKYPTVPSRSFMIYRKAFLRHDHERYTEYLKSVQMGTAKINTSTLYPYDIVHASYLKSDDENSLNTLWANLPDYVPEINGLVVADTSASMSSNNCLPLAISISLALYISERNKCPLWKNHFITFSKRPKLQAIHGRTLRERIAWVHTGEVSNTDLQAVFNLILDRAIRDNISEEDMPQILLIISDMEFDNCTNNSSATNFEEIDRRYRKAGYPRPHIVFWNVCSRNTQTPVTINDRGVTLLSGASPSVFNYALGKNTTPLELVHNITDSQRYSVIEYKK